MIRGYRKRALKRENSLVHASRGVGVDHVVDVCGAGTLEYITCEWRHFKRDACLMGQSHFIVKNM